MPHLHVETFVSQYFWLLFFLFTFYLLTYTKVLPKISLMFKTRAKLASLPTAGAASSGTTLDNTVASEGIIKLVLPTTQITSQPEVIKDHKWIKKYSS